MRDPDPEAEAVADRIDEYWDWIAVALFLLVTVDMLTTIYAAAAVGSAAEANPLVRWALARGVWTLATLNLVAAVLVVGFFYALVEILRLTPPGYRRPFALVVEVWLGLLLFAGLVVLANNVAAIVFGSTLVGR